MAVKRVLPIEQTTADANRRRNKAKFKNLIDSADTVAKLQKAVKALSKCVFGEADI